jgi:subtilase family serine protease
LTTTSVTVKNVGGTAAGDFEVTVSSVGAFTIGGLPTGGTETRTFASPCSRTVRSITAQADARNQVAESEETNNSTTISC